KKIKIFTETSEEEFVGFTYFYSPHKITRDISLGNSQFSPYVRLDRNVVARELEKMGKLKNERSHSMDSKFLRRSTRKKSACFIDYTEDDTSQSNSEPEIKKPTIKQRRKTCSWDTDEPYNPSQSNINKRRKTICKELDKAKSPRKRSKTPSKPEKQEAPISPIFETIPIKQKSSVSMKIPSFKSQSLFTFKDPVIELSWTEKMLTAPPTNFGKIQQRRKTLLSSPLLTFQNSSDLRDLDTNSNDSVILISSDQKPKDKCSKKDRVDKKQKLKNIEKSEGQLFKKLKGGESPPSIFSRQQNTEPSIESAVLGFKRLHLKTSNEPEEEPKKPVIQSCLKSVTSQNAPTVKKTKSISFKQPIEEKREIERVKKRRKTLHPTDSLQKPSIFDFSEKSSNGDFLKIKKRRQSSFKQTSNSSNPQVKKKKSKKIELVNELIGPPTPPPSTSTLSNSKKLSNQHKKSLNHSKVTFNHKKESSKPSQQMTPEAYREFHLQRTLDNFEMLTENSEHHNRITHRRNTTTDSKNGHSSSRRILTRRLSTVPDDNGVSSTVDIEESLSSPMTSPATGIEDRTPPTPDR
uniref:Uncharacterized protein n=1 Tax=Megaselia scalaris TaxID=36166 RepID=T1GVQ5_MEGSC